MLLESTKHTDNQSMIVSDMKMKKENNVKEILNEQVHSKINIKLMNREKQIEDIEEKLKKEKTEGPKDRPEWGGEKEWRKKERIVAEFAKFEEQVNQFDSEINEILFGREDKKEAVTDEEINRLLVQIQKNDKIMKGKDELTKIQEEENINHILQDIEKEF